MRSAVIEAPRLAGVCIRPRPRPAPGEVRVRLEGCGVSGSHLAVWGGQPWFSYPLPAGAPGHEGWGVIDEVGDDVDGVRTGMRVACLSAHAFAEFDVAPAEAVVELPQSLDGADVPGEALGCAVNVVERAGISTGQMVAVVGVGFLGALVVRLAVLAGATVVAASRRPFAREVACTQGAVAAVALGDAGATAAAVAAVLGTDEVPVVVETAGCQHALDVASRLVGTRGRLVVAGHHQDGPRHVDMQSWNWRGIDVINAHERALDVRVEGMRAGIAHLAAGRIDLSLLARHRYALDHLEAALSMLEQRPDGFLKAVVHL